jgi:predicted Zn-ribbon and HTH transcriptional regulator
MSREAKPKPPRVPAERLETDRRAIHDALLALGPLTVKELSAEVRLSEKAVIEHLEHLKRSSRAGGFRLEVTPAECLACGFSFAKRERLSTPGRCPVCQSERITPPAFSSKDT